MVKLQEYTFNQNSAQTLNSENDKLAQTFTVGTTGENKSYVVKQILLQLEKTLNPGDLRWEIQGVDESDDPNGVIYSEGVIEEADIPASYTNTTSTAKNLILEKLSTSTKYALVLWAPDSDGSNYITIKQHSSTYYTGGIVKTSSNGGTSWSDQAGDLYFGIYSDEYLGTLAKEIELNIMAGENIDTTGWTTDNKSLWIKQVESYLSVLTQTDLITGFPGYNDNFKRILSEYCARYCAICGIPYNMAGFTSRVEAEDMINIHFTRMNKIEKLLENPKYIKIATQT